MGLDSYGSGVSLNEQRVYIRKDIQQDSIVEVVEAKVFRSENPASRGNERMAVAMRFIENNSEQPADSQGAFNFFVDFDEGNAMARERKCSEACELAAAITGEPLADLLANPAKLRALFEDGTAYAGAQLRLTSKPPKTSKQGATLYNFRWAPYVACPEEQAPASSKKVKRPAAA